MIRFLNTREHNASEIHHQFCESYGPTEVSEGKGRQWCHEFREGCSYVHDEEISGRPSIQTVNLTERV